MLHVWGVGLSHPGQPPLCRPQPRLEREHRFDKQCFLLLKPRVTNLPFAGINKYKAITVFTPDDGSIPHVVTGYVRVDITCVLQNNSVPAVSRRYVGLWGALLGMSAEGLTVHEANLEEDEITFDGFPWLLRLRYIMENAHNNTVWRFYHSQFFFVH